MERPRCVVRNTSPSITRHIQECVMATRQRGQRVKFGPKQNVGWGRQIRMVSHQIVCKKFRCQINHLAVTELVTAVMFLTRSKIRHRVLEANIVFANIETQSLPFAIGTRTIIIRSVGCVTWGNGMKVPIRFARAVGQEKGRSAVSATVVLWVNIQAQ